MPTIHLIIKGKVQGVFYRASAKEKAVKMELNGWVKNTSEGHVEIITSGPDDVLQDYIQWCRKGPDKAHVTDIEVTVVPDEVFDGFRIRKDSFFG